MIQEYKGNTPIVDASAYIAPNAMIAGDVTIGKNVRVMFGAQIIAENSPVVISDNCIILENAVIRGTKNHPVEIQKNCLIGPHAHLAGCSIEDNVFIATGASVFHGAHIQTGSEVRINGIVHLKTVLPTNSTVPIGWIAIGNPVQFFSPDKHEELWKIQKPMNFAQYVYGIDRPKNDEPNNMPSICRVLGERLGEKNN